MKSNNAKTPTSLGAQIEYSLHICKDDIVAVLQCLRYGTHDRHLKTKKLDQSKLVFDLNGQLAYSKLYSFCKNRNDLFMT